MGKSFVWRPWGQGGLQRWVDDPARTVGRAGRSLKWYVADTWAEQHGVIGAKLFINGLAVLSKFGFKTTGLACAWADKQKVPSTCEHKWRHRGFLRPSDIMREAIPTLRACKQCGRRERRQVKNGHSGKWRLTLPSAQETELPR